MSPDQIVFFDGDCLFCNHSVHFIYKRNSKSNIFFAALQSEFAKQKWPTDHPMSENTLDTMIFVDRDKTYTYSSAAIHITKYLDGLWKTLFIFILIPKPFRDLIYKWIAKNRHKMMRKSELCIVPDKKFQKQILN